MPKVSSKETDEFEFMILKSEEERSKIGDFFKTIDNTIIIHQHKCDELKELKKGLLQQMFI